MKKLLFLTTTICLISLFASSQSVSITGFGGYTFRDKMSFGNAYGYLNESGHWGVSVEGIRPNGQGIELLFQHQSTHAPLYYYAAPNIQINPNSDQTYISYIMVNAVHYLMMSNVQPYGGLGIGVGIIDNSAYSTQTKFAWDAKLGIKFKASSQLGFKVQAQIFSIVQASGSAFYAGTGGAYFGVTSYSSIYQFGFSGGICFDLQKK